MATIPTEALMEYLARAQSEPIGLLIRTNHVHRLQNMLYTAINDSGYNIEALGLMLCVPALENTLFIMQRSVELDPP